MIALTPHWVHAIVRRFVAGRWRWMPFQTLDVYLSPEAHAQYVMLPYHQRGDYRVHEDPSLHGEEMRMEWRP